MGASDESVEVRNEGASQWREGARQCHGQELWTPGMRTRDSGERAKEGGVVVIRL